MKIPLIPSTPLAQIKGNLAQLTEFFKAEDCSQLESALETKLLTNTRFPEVKDFTLLTTADKPNETDFENTKMVFSSMPFLTPSQASDERLWAGLCLGPFWSYVKYRWNIDKKCTISNIRAHFFFGGTSTRKSLFRNAIARLWWTGKLTYNEALPDPWMITKSACNGTIANYVLEANFSSTPTITTACITAITNAQAQNLQISKHIVGELAKYLNVLGGTYLLDCMPKDRLYQKIYRKIESLQETTPG